MLANKLWIFILTSLIFLNRVYTCLYYKILKLIINKLCTVKIFSYTGNIWRRHILRIIKVIQRIWLMDSNLIPIYMKY